MSPAGDWDCVRAAVENGADAIYFGLQGGFNARARAANFSEADLPELMTFLRSRGVRGYVTLNTLVFGDELAEAERIARQIAAAGVDAVLVQDIGLLRLLHRLCPELPLHASTQMTLSSAECIAEVESLGVRRVVLPRETSISQIAAIRQQTNVELEAFVHGALCISYSGQCLASLSMGGRSANRGQCAQPCRLPYEVISDGLGSPDQPSVGRERGPILYPLSPHDLAAYDRLPELIAAGVSALKIEGRLKPPEYVASVTRHYRNAIDAAVKSIEAGESSANRPYADPSAVAEMETTFSRGFSHGWLDGPNHQTLVSGESSTHRGTYLGEVHGMRGERVLVELAGPVQRGDGLVFEGDRSQSAEQGGRVYEIFQDRRSVEGEIAGGLVELAFRYGSINSTKIQRGQKVWKTDDPQAARRIRKTYSGGPPQRCVPIDLTVEAIAGSRLRVTVHPATGGLFELESPDPLPVATKHPLTVDTLREQFGRLGKTPYELRQLDAQIDGQPMIPLSVLGKLRHEMVCQLEALASQPPTRSILAGSALAALREEDTKSHAPANQASAAPQLHVLCRSLAQLAAALACGVSSVIVDLRDLGDCNEAVRMARASRTKVSLATPRIQKPGESTVFERLARAEPEGLLVRNLAGLAFCRRVGLPAVADFSLNAVNDLTVRWLHDQGAERVTAAYDLDARRLIDLTAAVPPQWLEVVAHRHMPMFHSEYCLFCGQLSHGKNRRDCGQPCKRHELRLRDRMGVEHPLLADSQCRNTLLHAEAENLLEAMPSLLQRGVRHFRVELLLEDTAERIRRTLEPFSAAIGP
jgi:putative protease